MARKRRTIPDAAGRNMPLVRRGFGHLRQLASGNWQASYVGPDRQRHKAPKTFVTRDAAEAWLSGIRLEIANDKWRPDTKHEQLGTYGENWLATRRRKDGRPLAPKTKMNYASWFRSLEPFYDTPLDQITPQQCRKHHAKVTIESGATSAARQLSLLSRMLNTAVADGLIDKNPVPNELELSSTGIKHRPPTDAELAVVMEFMETNYPKLFCGLLIATFAGHRIGEWRALRRCDLAKVEKHYEIAVDRQAILVHGWQVTEPKSDEGTRMSALPEWVTPYIDDLLKTVGPDPNSLLFPAARGGKFIDSEWRTAWTKAREAAGIKGEVRGHDLRAYFATTLAEKGASAPHLKEALGHATIDMSMKYVKAAKKANPALAELLTKPAPLP